LKNLPLWLRCVIISLIISLNIVLLIIFLQDLPKAVDAVGEAGSKIRDALVPSPGSKAPDPPPLAMQPTDRPRASPTTPAQSTRCVALAMSSSGDWRLHSGTADSCSQIAEALQRKCSAEHGSPCSNVAWSSRWVAGIVCRASDQDDHWHGFVEDGQTQEDA